MQELKTELRFALTYLDSLKLLENEHSMKATKEAIEHALNLLKIINDRIEIAESKTINAPLPEARKWKEVKLEYDALGHLERLYNEKKVDFEWGGENAYKDTLEDLVNEAPTIIDADKESD